MKNFVLVALLAFGVMAPGASAGVLYELVDPTTGSVKATLEFDPATSNASDSSSWSAPGGVTLSSMLVGGISGFKVDFGSGLEAATGGDIFDPFAFVFESYTGQMLDFGIYWDNSNPVTFASGTIHYFNADNLPGQDTITGANFSVSGDWMLGTASDDEGSGDSVPEPGALASLAFGLCTIGILRRRRRHAWS